MFYTLPTTVWSQPFSSQEQQNAISALEDGQIIYLPQLPFTLLKNEDIFLSPRHLINRKNISFNPKNCRLKGTVYFGEEAGRLMYFIQRFSQQSFQLIKNLFPLYEPSLIEGRSSFRPAEIKGRVSSILKDDTRLHVDAFPATPNQGNRILRVFTNINPHGAARHWLLGESFEAVVKHFYSKLKRPFFGSRALLSWLKITKSYRSLYDHYMLTLHNEMKLSDSYQKNVSKTEMHFPPGATWIVLTDQVSHAALSGQHLLEQTYYLPVSSMQQPEKSPLKILESVLGKRLV